MASSPEQPRILLVDDEPDITAVLKTGLERLHGYSVDAFNDPDQALSQFKPTHYHAILLDIRMPNMTGFELARAMWERDPVARVCFMTAFEIYQQEAQKVFRDFKQHCFIKKPMSAKALAEHIEEHLLKA